MDVTVGQVLRLPAVQAGEPEIVAGANRLDNPVRWVHVAELKDLSGILQGGELVLTTGLALTGAGQNGHRQNGPGQNGAGPRGAASNGAAVNGAALNGGAEEDSRAEAAAYLEELVRAGASGVVVELLAGRERAVAALRAAAAGAAIPVILVRRRIRFVEVTEVVHRLIVARQLEQLEQARTVHEVFTALSLASAGPQEIVARTAEMLGAPVVLEDLSHLVIAYDGAGMRTQDLLGDWQERSRHVPFREETLWAGAEDWLQTPVGLQGQRWGRLIVPVAPADGSGAPMVLERAGQALSINRLAERDQRELSQQAKAGLLHELRQPRALAESEALTRAAALGLRPAPSYVPAVIRLDRQQAPDPIVLQRRERSLLELVNQVLRTAGLSALAASLQTGSVGILLAVPARQQEDPLLARICASLTERAAGDDAGLRWTMGVGRARAALLAAAAGLDEAAHVAETASTLRKSSRPFYRSTDVRLRGLLALLRDDPRVQAFAEAELAGLLDGGDGAELELLQKFLENGGNKAELARTGYLSRPTLYARLARLEQKLGVDLGDPESRTSLHVAVLLHRLGDLKQ